MAILIKFIPNQNIAGRINRKNEKIILAGGCFDILHIGHIKFLESAKKLGGNLVIMLENDKKVKLLKGNNRPIFNQKDRASALSALKHVDYIIMLPLFKTDRQYNRLVTEIKPDIIAVTAHDPIMEKKKQQAKIVGAKLNIIPLIKTHSSSKLAKILEID